MEKVIDDVDVIKLRESYKLIENALNKACLKGAFTLDESYVIKIAVSNIDETVGILEKRKK